MRVWPRSAIALQFSVAGLVAMIVVAFAVTSGAGLTGFVAAPALAFAVLAIGTRRYLRRARLAREPFPARWREVLGRRVPFYRDLDGAGRARFESDVRIFLSEQTIYGVGGTTVDEETRVLIAASAAMLGHGLPDFEWPSLRDVVVYPGRFDEDYELGKGDITGVVHMQGPVLFSRRDLKHGFRRAGDGHNVGLHELAHVMDMGTGDADGLPAGLPWVATAPWIKVVADRLRRVRDRKYRHVLRDYAGVNEAEFFAVAVEVFFEQPDKLLRRDPELYAMLADYFRQDPASGSSA